MTVRFQLLISKYIWQLPWTEAVFHFLNQVNTASSECEEKKWAIIHPVKEFGCHSTVKFIWQVMASIKGLSYHSSFFHRSMMLCLLPTGVWRKLTENFYISLSLKSKAIQEINAWTELSEYSMMIYLEAGSHHKNWWHVLTAKKIFIPGTILIEESKTSECKAAALIVIRHILYSHVGVLQSSVFLQRAGLQVSDKVLT